MKMQVIDNYGSYLVGVKANKRKSRTFYYKHISFVGVEFVLNKEEAHICPYIESAEFLANKYLEKRIKEVGLVLRNF
jgi:hypothetical protein